jgi:hypothetical protein
MTQTEKPDPYPMEISPELKAFLYGDVLVRRELDADGDPAPDDEPELKAGELYDDDALHDRFNAYRPYERDDWNERD